MKTMSGSRLFIIAVLCGLLAAGLVMYYMKAVESKYRKAAEPKVEKTIALVVPRQNMAKGQRIQQADIASRSVPEKYLPANAILASDYKKVLNRTLLSPVQKGRPMTWESVTGTSAATFSEVVELGRRAMTIKVSKVDSFDGLLRPGDRIDLMGVFQLDDLGLDVGVDESEPEDIVMAVLQEVEVIAASRQDLNGTRYEVKRDKNSADGFDMEFTMVTLNLTPLQVKRVQLAEETGDLFAVLRNPKDTSVSDTDYVGVEILLTEDKPEPVDLVLDANGNPVGRIVGDNVVDSEGNIIGKVVDGKAVGFDGKPLGQIVKNVSADDPIHRVAEVVDVVRDADGNIIGRVVNGQIVDRAGNVIGKVDEQGRAVNLSGKPLGTIERNVALDRDGNVVDTSKSVVAASQTRRETVVRDASGKIIGRVVDGKVINAAGQVIGRVDKNGRAVGLDGRMLGKTEEVLVNRQGEVVGREQKVVRDASGKVLGRIVDGKIVDANGQVIGQVGADGKPRLFTGKTLGKVGDDGVVRDENGQVIGRVVDGQVIDADGNVIGVVGEDGVVREVSQQTLSVETALVDNDGNVKATVTEVVRDKNGNVIGRVVNGEVVDANGNVIGRIGKDGQPRGLNGEVLGTVDKVTLDAEGRPIDKAVEVVRDANGNIIGRLQDGKVIDAAGNVVGELVNGQIVDANGNVLASNVTVSSESETAVAAEVRERQASAITQRVRVVDFIAGGTGKDGITPVKRIRVE